MTLPLWAWTLIALAALVAFALLGSYYVGYLFWIVLTALVVLGVAIFGQVESKLLAVLVGGMVILFLFNAQQYDIGEKQCRERPAFTDFVKVKGFDEKLGVLGSTCYSDNRVYTVINKFGQRDKISESRLEQY